MTSLEVSVKDVFFVAIALIAVAITAYAPFILIRRLGRVWRREETGLGWSELALSGSMLVFIGVLLTINVYVDRNVELNHLHDFRSLSGAHHWSIMLVQLAVALFGWCIGGFGVVLCIVSLLRRPKE